VNEQWQSGADDMRKPLLQARWPHPPIFVNPDDAAPEGIESGDFVEIVNDTVYVQTGSPIGVKPDDLSFTRLMERGHIKVTEGRFTAVAIVTDEMRPGVAKATFATSKAMANSVCHAVPDPVTGNYRYKLGRGRLTRIGESPFKAGFDQLSLKPRPIV
jgi:arsenite oxidase large subunit